MATTVAVEIHNLRDLLRQLGDIPPERVRFRPAPGTATVADVEKNKLCELIDGTLVEKAMGAREGFLALALGAILRAFVKDRKLGLVFGADSTLEIDVGLVRLPDVAYVSWDRLPGRRVPTESVPDLVPDLAVEVLSKGNTEAEMARKRREYFKAGVRLVWMVDPKTRTVGVYTSLKKFTTLTESDTLGGGTVLPGFKLPLSELFAELDQQG
jgi:Uma2 family endonuclease